MAVTIRALEFHLWHDLASIRCAQLLEEGIPESEITGGNEPDPTSPYDWDLNNFDSVYTCKRGDFWLAYMDNVAVGCVGLQDIGPYGELRRMYVLREYRRQGIGRQLCHGLLAHAANSGLKIVELWTARDGNGEGLYRSVGFRVVEPSDFILSAACDAVRGTGEVRMRRDL